jgi:hypothetical protein
MKAVKIDCCDESLRVEPLSYASFKEYEYPTAWLELAKMGQPFLAEMRSRKEISINLEVLLPEEMLTSVGAFIASQKDDCTQT